MIKNYSRKLLFIITLYFISSVSYSQFCYENAEVPFSTDSTFLTIWNGQDYIPFFVKGINFGVSVPGKFPGQLEVSREQYTRWLEITKSAGFNTIRLYTLHYPHFYEVLDSFNLANPHNPILFFQGVWLEEEYPGFNGDLYILTDAFTNEIQENVDCVHGNRFIPERLGKAHGLYSTDVSRWNLGYIIGREVYSEEVLYTIEQNSTIDNSFVGNHFSIHNAHPAEIWFVQRIDDLVNYEQSNYNTQRPVSITSWPTLDPLEHPGEWNPYEDTISINMGELVLHNAPAGYFASYHAYPYYPDFISEEPAFQEYSDTYGPNSYLGYLTNLKNHYEKFPLIIAEFGVPSSWGVAHWSHSGMNHGGFDEINQGISNMRMLQNIKTSNCGGGIQFALMDEWFKRSWITDPIDYLMDRRVIWHNISAAEQNYGIIGFKKNIDMITWEEFCESCNIQNIKVGADFRFFHLEIEISQALDHPDEMWIGIDTYSEDLGESVLPNGETLPYRSEFALHINNHSGTLYVTEAYDIFQIWHGLSGDEQLFHSIPTDGAPWYIVRWKNNRWHEDVQYIGNLQLNNDFLPASTKDAVTIYNDRIKIRIPWSLINVVDPSTMTVFHDYRNTPEPEDTISDGFAVSVHYKGEIFSVDERFIWENWNHALEAEEYLKESFWITKENMGNFNSPAIAVCDNYNIDYTGEPIYIDASNGVLNNDYDLDGNNMIALVLDNAINGNVHINEDGSFYYSPNIEFSGIDEFSYVIFDGYSLSAPANVFLDVYNTAIIDDDLFTQKENMLTIFPNPATDFVNIKSKESINDISIFDSNGRRIIEKHINDYNYSLKLSSLNQGVYFLKFDLEDETLVKKITIHR